MKVARLIVAAATALAIVAGGQVWAQGTETKPADSTASSSPFSWITMPKVAMPKVEMPKMPAPIKSSAQKVGDGTKKAWEGTKEIFSMGSAKTPPKTVVKPAKPAPQKSLWQKMFGTSASNQPKEPATVAEWMHQPRIDP